MSWHFNPGLEQKPKIVSGLPLLLFFLATFLFASPSVAVEIPLQRHSGVYTLPVRLNGVITLTFILDSGASEVTIPSGVALALLRAGTISRKDFLPGQRYMLANGSIVTGSRFMIRQLEVGGLKIFDIPAVVSSVRGPPLLGQSFLARARHWEIDNDKRVLVISGLKAAKSRSTKVEFKSGISEGKWLSSLPGAAGRKMPPEHGKLPPSRLFYRTPSGKIGPSR